MNKLPIVPLDGAYLSMSSVWSPITQGSGKMYRRKQTKTFSLYIWDISRVTFSKWHSLGKQLLDRWRKEKNTTCPPTMSLTSLNPYRLRMLNENSVWGCRAIKYEMLYFACRLCKQQWRKFSWGISTWSLVNLVMNFCRTAKVKKHCISADQTIPDPNT